jgi:putative alpha-1,2-mannosidase
MSAMGFYSVDPVSGNYIFGTPLFDHVSLQLGKGRQLEIVANRKSPTDQYIQSVCVMPACTALHAYRATPIE